VPQVRGADVRSQGALPLLWTPEELTGELPKGTKLTQVGPGAGRQCW